MPTFKPYKYITIFISYIEVGLVLCIVRFKFNFFRIEIFCFEMSVFKTSKYIAHIIFDVKVCLILSVMSCKLVKIILHLTNLSGQDKPLVGIEGLARRGGFFVQVINDFCFCIFNALVFFLQVLADALDDAAYTLGGVGGHFCFVVYLLSGSNDFVVCHFYLNFWI